MKINKIEIIPYKIKLKNTFINSRTEYSFKEGFIIELSIDDIVGYGEIVFLDGFVSCNKQEIYWLVSKTHFLKQEIKDNCRAYSFGNNSLNVPME